MDIAVLNNSGTAILMGQVVYQTGFVQPQQVPSIGLASAASASTANVLGVVTTTIPNGSIGQVRVSGDFAPIDTTLFIPYAKVYLSDTPGAISPFAGTIEVVIGQVKISALSGCIRISCPITKSCDLPSSCSTPTSGSQGATGVQGIQGATGIGSGGGGGGNVTLGMNAVGNLQNAGSLPVTNIGPELTGDSATLIWFRARRGFAGSSGTTTIQLELNGTPVIGATLSWTSIDPNFTLKFVAISVAVVPGDRLSFRLTSREGGSPRDIYAEVNS